MTEEAIKVGGNNIDDIVKRLRANDQTLTNIEYCPFEAPRDKWDDGDYQSQVFSKLVDAICVNTGLKKFSVENRIPFNPLAFGKMMGRLLAKNRGLHALSVKCTEIGPTGAEEIARGLAANKTLRTFYSSFNNFGNEGAAHIFKALETNTGLRHITLAHEHMGDDGAQAFATALQKNKTLIGFSLGNNEISGKGLEDILSALLVNKTIEKADLSKLDMGASGARNREKNGNAFNRLIEVIQKNKTIIDLDISYPIFDFAQQDHARVGQALSQNKKISILTMECWGMFPKPFFKFVTNLKGNKNLTVFHGSDLQNFSSTDPSDAEISKAFADSLRGNPNFVIFWPSSRVDFQEVITLQKENAQKAQEIIQKALAPDTPFTEADAAYFHKAMHGIYEIAKVTERHKVATETSYYRRDEARVEKYAYQVLVMANKKVQAAGKPALKIPLLYRPYDVDDHTAVTHEVDLNAKKVDFQKLLATKVGGSFATAAKGKKFFTIAHQAVSAGQLDELLDYMETTGQRLGSKELLFRPKEDGASVAEIMAAQKSLGRILTASHWKDDLEGLKCVEEALGFPVIASQMPEGTSLEDVKWEIESAALSKSTGKTHKPIRIGVKAK